VSFGKGVKKRSRKGLEKIEHFTYGFGESTAWSYLIGLSYTPLGTGGGFGVSDLIVLMYYGFEMILHR